MGPGEVFSTGAFRRFNYAVSGGSFAYPLHWGGFGAPYELTGQIGL